MNNGISSALLADTLRAELNRFAPGERLPSTRALVQRFATSPVTVSRALAALTAEGLVVTRPGSGTYRAPTPPRDRPADTSWQQLALSAEESGDATPRSVDATGVLATLTAPPPGVIPLNEGYLHASLRPDQALGAALARAARRPDAWDRPPVAGLSALRTWFARETHGSVTAEDVLITAGGQSALTTALRALATPGAPLLVESPTYYGALAVARAAGLRPVPVPVDAEGIRPDLLAEAFTATGARVLLCQPLFQNPTGAVLSTERRRAVLELARAAGAFVIEDDYARRLAHGSSPVPPPLVSDDPDGTVVHIASLTKPTSPSLRVGAIVARGPVVQRLRAIQVVDSFFVPRPLQEAALELVGSPAWPRHLRTVGAGLRDRAAAFAAALHGQLPDLPEFHHPSGGYQFWLPLPPATDETALTSTALRHGLALTPGRPYFPAESPGPHLRISIAATSGPDELTEAARRLAQAMADLP
jgi:DNA-binding transcriptional MocR family regulator